ncbi:hypothetical protein ACE3MZ_19160 [Paenibacillus sp. WLX1005]|uniref:hypothetical protein n=1 Tax=Paenibacillus sp. WLX1005 TaxID=3243766 RepID=UPI003983F534
MSWKIFSPTKTTYRGEITPLTDEDLKSLLPILDTQRQIDGWFDWASFVEQHPEYHYYKLKRFGARGILGVIALTYHDGVFVASVETAKHSRHRPENKKRYINLADIMLSFASYWGTVNHNDPFVALIPKDNKVNYYKRKFGAKPFGRVYALDQSVIRQMIRLYYY